MGATPILIDPPIPRSDLDLDTTTTTTTWWAVASSLGAAGEWFSAWVMVYRWRHRNLGRGSQDIHLGRSCAVSWRLLTFGFYCPETTGRTLEEIDVLFAKPGPRRDALEAAAAAAAAGQTTGRGGSVVSARHAYSEKLAAAEHVEGKGDGRV